MLLTGELEKPIIVGLPDAAVKESAERVQSAVNNSGYRFPTHTGADKSCSGGY